MKSKTLGLGLMAGMLALSASARSEELLERIAVAVLADKFGIDTREVVVLQQQTRLPVYELSPILEGSYYFRQRPTTVWQMREQGLGWGQIAQRVGMHPGTFNKLRKQGAFDRDRFWAMSYRERFGVPETQITVVRQRGGTLEDVLAAIVIGKLTNKPPQDVYARYQTERSWATVASIQNVRIEQWQKVSVPTKVHYTLASSNVKTKSDSKVKVTTGSGKSKDMDKGKGNGNGNGNSKSQGQGQGKGKGKGKGG